MLRNATRVSLEDIVHRQEILSRGYDVLQPPDGGDWKAPYAADRAAFVRVFYQYARANPNGHPQLWSEWLKSGTAAPAKTGQPPSSAGGPKEN
jgi:protein-tyrosine phosphatase